MTTTDLSTATDDTTTASGFKTPIDAHHSPVSLRARFDTHGLLGLLGRRAILAQTRRTIRHLTADVRHYVPTGEPSPGKQRQQRRMADRSP